MKTDDRKECRTDNSTYPKVAVHWLNQALCIIQGLASMSDYEDHFYLHLIENAPFNKGKHKLYQGVPGNLFTFACKLSRDQGYEGIVAFQSKTKLIEHYEKTLGATHIGAHKMIIFPKAALKLIQQYFKV